MRQCSSCCLLRDSAQSASNHFPFLREPDKVSLLSSRESGGQPPSFLSATHRGRTHGPQASFQLAPGFVDGRQRSKMRWQQRWDAKECGERSRQHHDDAERKWLLSQRAPSDSFLAWLHGNCQKRKQAKARDLASTDALFSPHQIASWSQPASAAADLLRAPCSRIHHVGLSSGRRLPRYRSIATLSLTRTEAEAAARVSKRLQADAALARMSTKAQRCLYARVLAAGRLPRPSSAMATKAPCLPARNKTRPASAHSRWSQRSAVFGASTGNAALGATANASATQDLVFSTLSNSSPSAGPRATRMSLRELEKSHSLSPTRPRPRLAAPEDKTIAQIAGW